MGNRKSVTRTIVSGVELRKGKLAARKCCSFRAGDVAVDRAPGRAFRVAPSRAVGGRSISFCFVLGKNRGSKGVSPGTIGGRSIGLAVRCAHGGGCCVAQQSSLSPNLLSKYVRGCGVMMGSKGMVVAKKDVSN